MRSWIHEHSLGIACVSIALALYLMNQFSAYYDWDETTGGWREQVWLHGEGVWEFAQSAFLVLASKVWIERGSAESKEGA